MGFMQRGITTSQTFRVKYWKSLRKTRAKCSNTFYRIFTSKFHLMPERFDIRTSYIILSEHVSFTSYILLKRISLKR